jgi:ATP-dependent helicase/nuclease subunit A
VSFLLAGTKEKQDRFMQHILDRHAQAETREDANLLYVAITRPKQFLFISGCQPLRGDTLGWYGLLRAPFVDENDKSPDNRPLFTSGKQATTSLTTDMAPTDTTATQKPIEPITLEKPKSGLAPSRQATDESLAIGQIPDPDGRTRGIAIHRMLQLLSEHATDIPRRVAAELSLPADDTQLAPWFDNASHVFQSAEFTHLFDPAQFVNAFNEVPLSYNKNGQNVYGIIDRLVIAEDCIWLVDYKTHQTHNSEELDALVEHYQAQLEYYRAGIQRLWPALPVKAGLLFTNTRTWKPLMPSDITRDG